MLAAPLENEGEVVGLIYVDSQVGHRSFEEADLRLLTSLANVAAAKIQNARLMAEAAEKKQMDREFALAREIQQRLLPESPPTIAGYELHGSNTASRQVSGDYFDFRVRSDKKVYAASADVCGKGVGPALLMASLQASFHAWADESVPVSEMTGRLSEAIDKSVLELVPRVVLGQVGESGIMQVILSMLLSDQLEAASDKAPVRSETAE